MQNLKYEFSEVELDLIADYVEKNKGTVTRTKNGLKDKFFVSSGGLSACIRVTGMEERTIFVCQKVFGTYYDDWCTNPTQLKLAFQL